MSQAIHTKFLPKGRIKATAARGSLIMHYDQASTAHADIARALCRQFCAQDQRDNGTPPEGNPWNRPFVTGDLPNGDKVHVFAFDLLNLFSGPDELPEAIGTAIADEFMLRKDREHKDRWQTKGGTFRARGIACRAARIFLETTKDGWGGRTE